MDRTYAVRTFTDAERARGSEETVINGAPYIIDPRAAGRSAYWNAYLHDRAPDLDEWLNEIQSAAKSQAST